VKGAPEREEDQIIVEMRIHPIQSCELELYFDEVLCYYVDGLVLLHQVVACLCTADRFFILTVGVVPYLVLDLGGCCGFLRLDNLEFGLFGSSAS